MSTSQITHRDDALLRWFFGPGQSAFERSPFGAILDRAELLRYDSDACQDCTGGILDNGAWCPMCNGVGSVPRVRRHSTRALTARPMTRDGSGQAAEPDDTHLRWYASVSRRLSHVERLDPACACAIEAYYGNHGARWAMTKFGRFFALFPLVPAGKTLLRQTKGDLTMQATDRIHVLAELEKIQPMKQRGELFKAAGRQAADLHDEACRRWNEVTNG